MASKEFNVNIGLLELNLEWRLALFTILLFPAFIYLGVWQLSRADEKHELEANYTVKSTLPPLELATLTRLSATDKSFEGMADRLVVFSGNFMPEDYLLIDNRIRDGRFGYEVIAFVGAGGVKVPVNLGWIMGDAARRSLPSVILPDRVVELVGRIYIPSGEAYLLVEQAEPSSLPSVVQDYPAVRFAGVMADLLGRTVLPLVVRIDEKHPLAKRADWFVINQSPQRHVGYAMQWFTMAAVLLIVFFWQSSNVSALFRRCKQYKSS